MRLFRGIEGLKARDANLPHAMMRVLLFAFAAMALAVSCLGFPTTAQGADLADSTFNDPDTAWAGYASTAAANAPNIFSVTLRSILSGWNCAQTIFSS